MIDLFRILKLDYEEYVILFKSGSFYVSFDEDSIILNKLLNYKILNLKNNIKIGFPLGNIDNVTSKLEELKINYIIIDKKSIVKKYEDEDNNFNKFTSSVFEVISINERINKIVDKLKSIDNDSVKEILDEIENMIDV
jgi:DNA mismatch repair ATPase MutS